MNFCRNVNLHVIPILGLGRLGSFGLFRTAWGISLAAGLVVCVLGGCAGPTTPLGAVWALTPSQARSTPAEDRALSSVSGNSTLDPAMTLEPAPSIRFLPSQQVLHGPSHLKVVISDWVGDLNNYEIRVKYNGLSVTRSFLRHARVSTDPGRRQITFENPVVRLTPMQEHLIDFIYKSSSGSVAHARYEPPMCYAFREKPVFTLGDFKPSVGLIGAIERLSREEGINPSFLAGLIAQESAFNPTVVSWSKAIGLTQITSIAEQELAEKFPQWPRYRGIEKMTIPEVKFMIAYGKINGNNEWRLNVERSVQGGIAFARYLAERWSTPEILGKIRNTFKDPESVHTQLVLASYHSGYSRVLSAFERLGKDWLKDPDLKEARKYVNRIFSYCSYFSEKEV